MQYVFWEMASNMQQVRDKYQLHGTYLVYCGRISKSKGCDTLFEHFLRFRDQIAADVSLVVLGDGDYPVNVEVDSKGSIFKIWVEFIGDYVCPDCGCEDCVECSECYCMQCQCECYECEECGFVICHICGLDCDC